MTIKRKDGWYWVKKLDWDDKYSDWVPALWLNEYRSWKSAQFGGIPDQDMIVGPALVPPEESDV